MRDARTYYLKNKPYRKFWYQLFIAARRYIHTTREHKQLILYNDKSVLSMQQMAKRSMIAHNQGIDREMHISSLFYVEKI